MPVSKFRSIEEVPSLFESGPEGLASRIRTLWARAFTLARPLEFRGVTRYKTIEEATAARYRATLDRMRATRP